MLEKRVVSQCISSDYCKGWNDAVEAANAEDREMPELKPCPFCGGKAKLNEGTYVDTGEIELGYAYVECTVCGAATDEFAADVALCANDVAAQAWNSRK